MRSELRDALEFLYGDSEVGRRPCRAMTLDVARGGTAAVHVLLNGLTPGKTLRARVRRGGRKVRDAGWFRLVDVPVEENTGVEAFVEKDGERNPYVTRRAPFRVFDAMAPTAGSVRVDTPTIALRLHVPVPRNVRPGRRSYTVEVECGGDRAEMKMNVRARRPVIPPVGPDSFPYTNYYSLRLMASRHGLKLWSAAHWRMVRRYADLMAHGRQNVFWFPLDDMFTLARKRPVLNRARLHRLVRTCTAAGMYYIEGPFLAGRTGGTWKAETFDVALTGARATSGEGHAVLAAVCGQLMGEIERNGWRGRWVQHVADEPIAANAADYRILTGMVRKHMPGIPILEPVITQKLEGSVDIWCPQCQYYQQHRRHFDAQRALGDRVWVYTCCAPGGPWLNRLLDTELLRPALIGWAAARYRLDGFLHWGLNHYRDDQDPFRRSVVGYGGGNKLPAGDTHIVYPGEGRPWSSVRLEAHREGLEDYELLRKLEARNPRAAAAAIRKAIRGFDQYTKVSKTFRAARAAMFEGLE